MHRILCDVMVQAYVPEYRLDQIVEHADEYAAMCTELILFSVQPGPNGEVLFSPGITEEQLVGGALATDLLASTFTPVSARSLSLTPRHLLQCVVLTLDHFPFLLTLNYAGYIMCGFCPLASHRRFRCNSSSDPTLPPPRTAAIFPCMHAFTPIPRCHVLAYRMRTLGQSIQGPPPRRDQEAAALDRRGRPIVPLRSCGLLVCDAGHVR
jgi:hypothetical protein